MTPPLDVAALRALLEAGTPGPWSLDPCSNGGAILRRGQDSVRHMQSHLQIAPESDAELIVAAVNALPALLAELDGVRQGEDAVRAFVAWLDAEDERPDYGTQTRETHPEGERIWRERWERNLRLCGEAQDKGHAFLALLDRARGEGR